MLFRSDSFARLRAEGLDTVFLAAPTSTERRLRLIAEYSTGFIYLVSRTGVTGERDTLSASVQPLVESMRQVTSTPLAIGFGISKPEQAVDAGRLADAIITGSAFVRTIEQNLATGNAEAELEKLARELKQALERIEA